MEEKNKDKGDKKRTSEGSGRKKGLIDKRMLVAAIREQKMAAHRFEHVVKTYMEQVGLERFIVDAAEAKEVAQAEFEEALKDT